MRQFPQNRDVVVSVARKTDAQMWPALFAAVGVPSSMLDSLLEAGMLQSAACCLLIVDRIEGPQAAHGRALQLIQASGLDTFLKLAAEVPWPVAASVEPVPWTADCLLPWQADASIHYQGVAAQAHNLE